MAAKTIVDIGNKSVDATNRPGLERALTVKKPKTSAAQEPAPTIAASAEAAKTSFNRIHERSLMKFCATSPSLELVGEKRRQEYHKAGPFRGATAATSELDSQGRFTG
jgi:hypothetical protein